MNDRDGMNQVLALTDEFAPAEGVEPDMAAAELKDGEVPPSGALPPDPTGLGALA